MEQWNMEQLKNMSPARAAVEVAKTVAAFYKQLVDDGIEEGMAMRMSLEMASQIFNTVRDGLLTLYNMNEQAKAMTAQQEPPS